MSNDHRLSNLKIKFVSLLPPQVLYAAIKVSLVVGTLLNLINQWDLLSVGQYPAIGDTLLNYLVPFCVSLYSGTKALSSHDLNNEGDIQATRRYNTPQNNSE